MSRTSSIAITAGLLGSGVLAWTFAARPLLTNADLKVPVNPLGINRSPYGEVFAMAIQGPIDEYFDADLGGNSKQQESEDERADESKTASAPKNLPWTASLRNLINSLAEASEVRTNPKGASEALRRYVRRQIEDKLRFAYNLDPSHYANYNSLHFFLTEPELGTRPELTPTAAKLAEDTIQYCLKQNDDPRPALTAAAACTNILQLMFSDRHNTKPKYTTGQMRQCLDLLDHCIARYDMIAKSWDESKHWDLLSPQRIAECQERHDFICKIREASEKTILRYEQESQSQTSN